MAVTGNWKLLASLVFASSLAGCAASARMISGLPPVPVSASGETQPVGTNRADAADDPAIWVDPANPNHAQIGSAHVWTPVTNAHLVCRLQLVKKKHIKIIIHTTPANKK